MAMLPADQAGITLVSSSSTTRVMNSAWKIGVNSQASRLKGFAPG